jgi:hypothetical protein
MLGMCLELAMGLALGGERHQASGGVEDPVTRRKKHLARIQIEQSPCLMRAIIHFSCDGLYAPSIGSATIAHSSRMSRFGIVQKG